MEIVLYFCGMQYWKDPRYDLIETMIQIGKIRTWSDIFTYIPKTVVAKDLGKKVDRFNELVADPAQFRLYEIESLACFFEIDIEVLLRLITAYRRRARIPAPGGRQPGQ